MSGIKTEHVGAELRVTVDDFTVSIVDAADDGVVAVKPAIDLLVDQLLRKAYGVSRHDLLMAVFEAVAVKA